MASAPPGLEVGLDVSTLRQLLLEQSDKIRESGDRALAAAMPKLRQKQEEYLIEAKVQRLSDRVQQSCEQAADAGGRPTVH